MRVHVRARVRPGVVTVVVESGAKDPGTGRRSRDRAVHPRPPFAPRHDTLVTFTVPRTHPRAVWVGVQEGGGGVLGGTMLGLWGCETKVGGGGRGK